VYRYIDEHRDDYLAWLFEACAQPSISAQNRGMEEMACLVKRYLDGLGAETQLVTTKGYPFVYGETGDAPSGRTISFYNHYDVQPVEPLDEWESDPFKPEIREGRIFGRGTADNKGNLVARLCAVHAWQQVHGALPLKVKFVFEGEEEVGSPHLEDFAKNHPEKVETGGFLWEGGSRTVGGPVHVALGAKGMCYVELSVQTAEHDLHSMTAAIVKNPAWRLVWALAALKGEDERILIDGFYDDVAPVGDLDRKYIEELEFDEEAAKRHYGIGGFLQGLAGYPLKERFLCGPTCNIAGILSGYTGPGGKTVLPSKASVKMDLRLVPDQNPQKVLKQLRSHLDAHGFGDIKIQVHSWKPPFRTDPEHVLAKTVINAVKKVYGHEPAVWRNLAGTSPIHDLCRDGNYGAVQVGVANEDSRAHAPNENIFVEDFIEGIKLVACVMNDFADAERL